MHLLLFTNTDCYKALKSFLYSSSRAGSIPPIRWRNIASSEQPSHTSHKHFNHSKAQSRAANNPILLPQLKSHLRNQRLVEKRVFFFCLGKNGGEMEFEPHELRSLTRARGYKTQKRILNTRSKANTQTARCRGLCLPSKDGNILRHSSCPTDE